MFFTKRTKLDGKWNVIGYDSNTGMYLVKDADTDEKKWIKSYIFEALQKIEGRDEKTISLGCG
jgi:hypothetical protein